MYVVERFFFGGVQFGWCWRIVSSIFYFLGREKRGREGGREGGRERV